MSEYLVFTMNAATDRVRPGGCPRAGDRAISAAAPAALDKMRLRRVMC
jgi:hypothetical protein